MVSFQKRPAAFSRDSLHDALAEQILSPSWLSKALWKGVIFLLMKRHLPPIHSKNPLLGYPEHRKLASSRKPRLKLHTAPPQTALATAVIFQDGVERLYGIAATATQLRKIDPRAVKLGVRC